VGSGDDGQDRDSYQFIRPPAVAAGSGVNELELDSAILAHAGANSGQHAHQIVAAQARLSPEIPALGIAGEVAQLYVNVGRRFLNAAFPPRHRHGGSIHLLAQLRLAHFQAPAKRQYPFGPLKL
jgi:hypothetical protein